MRCRGFVLILLCATVLPSCDEDRLDPVDIVLSFSSQDRWTYFIVQTMTDSVGVTTELSHDSVEVWVGATDDTVLGMTGLVRLESRSLLPSAPSVFRSADTMRVWYRVSDRSVVEVAYQNAGGVTLLKTSQPGLSLYLYRFSVLDPLATFEPATTGGPPILREEERLVLLYPLTQFAGWVSFTRPFRQTREVEAFEDVSVPAGRFATARIRTTTDIGSLVFHDWVGTNGLVRRFLELEAILTTGDNPDGVGTATMRTETVLTSVVR